MRKTAFIAMLLLCFSALPATTKPLMGWELLEICNSKTRPNLGKGYCHGYIRGAIAGRITALIDIVKHKKLDEDEIQRAFFSCVTEYELKKKVVGVVKKYIADRPHMKNFSAMYFIVNAVRQEFPCKPK